jgi:hypothetical protein
MCPGPSVRRHTGDPLTHKRQEVEEGMLVEAEGEISLVGVEVVTFGRRARYNRVA